MTFVRKASISSLITFLSIALGSSAHAITIDFQALADGTLADGAWGESAWQPLNTQAAFGVDVDFDGWATINQTDTRVYAYLDRNTAGLGTCKVLNAAGTAALNSTTGSGTNLCNPGSDDNVTEDEWIRITANENVVIESIVFNNNHDPNKSLDGDTIQIGNNAKTFGVADHDGVTFGPNNELWGDFIYSIPITLSPTGSFDIKFVDEQFYISSITIRAVPEPGTVALLAAGLIGLGILRRRRLS